MKTIPCKMNYYKYQCLIVILVYLLLLVFIIFDETNIILNGKWISYSVLFRFFIVNFFHVTFASNLIRMQKLRRFLMIGQRSNVCQRHIQRTSFNSNTVWLPYQMKLSCKSTAIFPTINQPH